MANHKKAWADDDIVLNGLSFPKLPKEKLAEPITEKDLVCGGERIPPTGKYKYRCPDCGVYFGSEVEHLCK